MADRSGGKPAEAAETGADAAPRPSETLPTLPVPRPASRPRTGAVVRVRSTPYTSLEVPRGDYYDVDLDGRAVPSWRFGPGDMAIASAMLAVTTALSIGVALHLREGARQADRQRADSQERAAQLLAASEHTESRRAMLAHLRTRVNRYVGELQSRPILPWTTAVRELSRLKPQGLWLTRMESQGPRFRLTVRATRADLVAIYVQRLRGSACVEFVSLPPGEKPQAQAQILGRWTGE
jgi:DNA-binding transcriptional ArsR family regulator